ACRAGECARSFPPRRWLRSAEPFPASCRRWPRSPFAPRPGTDEPRSPAPAGGPSPAALPLRWLPCALPRSWSEVLLPTPTAQAHRLLQDGLQGLEKTLVLGFGADGHPQVGGQPQRGARPRSEEHTSELQSREKLVCRLLLEKKS